jgi:hypothetical protein
MIALDDIAKAFVLRWIPTTNRQEAALGTGVGANPRRWQQNVIQAMANIGKTPYRSLARSSASAPLASRRTGGTLQFGHHEGAR